MPQLPANVYAVCHADVICLLRSLAQNIHRAQHNMHKHGVHSMHAIWEAQQGPKRRCGNIFEVTDSAPLDGAIS
jgi:hypothetical protein